MGIATFIVFVIHPGGFERQSLGFFFCYPARHLFLLFLNLPRRSWRQLPWGVRLSVAASSGISLLATF
jgi:hypothetical protein